MNRSDTDKWNSWYLAMVFAGVEPTEAARLIAEIRAEHEAALNAVGGG